MNTVYLLLGSNLGNRLLEISKAIVMIDKHVGKIIERSPLYETDSWGFKTSKKFINIALIVKTKKRPAKVLEKIQRIEQELGRKKTKKGYESRIIDIDIIFFNNEIINEEKLVIPHERAHERRFVLEPMNFLAPDYIHPVFNKNVGQLLENCMDELSVGLFDG